jgi:ribonuclease III
VLRLFAHKISHAQATALHQDWKTSLQERLAEYKLPMPVYEATSVGPEHEQVFTASVNVLGRIIGEGTGTNKKLAEQAGAHQALELLNDPKARAELIQCQNSQK